MPPLLETQRLVRLAVVTGEVTDVAPILVGGRDPGKRLAIHHRHYETSLVTALLGKFPAAAWLVGSTFTTQAVQQFVRERPPHALCIAEYGADFPEFLSTRPTADRVPYLRAFAELEWYLGRVSLAVTRPALTQADLAGLDPERLVDLRMALQPGIHYFHAGWAVDDLMRLYLMDSAPDRFTLDEGDVWIELRGARGEMHMNRLDRGTCAFRMAVSAGQPLGEAAASALDVDATFDPGQALTALISEGLATSTDHLSHESST